MSGTPINEPTKFVTFRLEEEIFALDINQVREVLDYTVPTKVPGTPRFMVGVINLRGSVVPVVDLRLKFGRKETPKTVETRIVIMEVNVDDEPTVLGALADSVKEVIELAPEQIGAPPRIGMRLRTDFIKGMGRKGDQFIIILDIEKVFTVEELTEVQGAEATAARMQEGETQPDGAGLE